jgi:hypothetical protein
LHALKISTPSQLNSTHTIPDTLQSLIVSESFKKRYKPKKFLLSRVVITRPKKEESENLARARFESTIAEFFRKIE